MAILKKPPRAHTPDCSPWKLLLCLRIIFSDKLTFNKPLVPADVLAQRDGGVGDAQSQQPTPGQSESLCGSGLSGWVGAGCEGSRLLTLPDGAAGAFYWV